MKNLEEEIKKKYFTDFNGLFKAKLLRVIPRGMEVTEFAGVTSEYTCRIIAEYDRKLVRLLDDGMLLAVRNFRTRGDELRYTLMEIVRFWPEHFGLKGLRDYHYYPIQFEVVEQSVGDWETSDKSTMVINIVAVPISYDLVVNQNGEMDFEKGFSYPVVGDNVYILNAETIKEMYNKGISEKYGERKEASLGIVKMFERVEEKSKIPIFVDFDSLIKYHFGIFAFTGGGKSNLLSTIIRKIIYNTKDNKIVIFDISCEYPFLLLDVFCDDNVESKIVLESKVSNWEEFYKSIVKPKKYENDKRVKKAFEKIFGKRRVTFLTEELVRVPTYGDILRDIHAYIKSNTDKRLYVEILEKLEVFVKEFIESNNLTEGDSISEVFVQEFSQKASELANTKGIWKQSEVYGWLTTREGLLETLKKSKEQKEREGLTFEEIIDLIENEKSSVRLVCISISEAEVIKRLAMDVTNIILLRRKQTFRTTPQILFVFDEAQEFVPGREARGLDRECSEKIERLLRQGRKYGLGGCIATQRVAYLNTNVLQQLHTNFVSTLPRIYDRNTVSQHFNLDREMVDKTLEFVQGEWLLASYIATGISNVPIFIKAENSEDVIEKFLEKLEKKGGNSDG